MKSIALDQAQHCEVRRLMEAIVGRDEGAVADMLARDDPETVYAAPASDFWRWADDYGGVRLNLVLPPGEVADWGIWGFPLKGRPDVLALHLDVWADWGQTDLTVQFNLAPHNDGCRVELHDMHVM